jgi:hypothetical protein
MSRDEFSKSVKDALAKRVCYRCSNPNCKAMTSGPHTEPERSVNVGVAAHISAASPGGPRYDSDMSSEERSSIENAIWLCQSCAKLVDADSGSFTKRTLVRWKVTTEAEVLRLLGGRADSDYFPQPVAALHAPIPQIGGLSYDDARMLLLQAGWQPIMNHWSHASNPDMRCGNGLYFWEKGYHEIVNACPTGLAFCKFALQDVYGNHLVVVTAGEVFEEIDATAHVWRWYFNYEDTDS